MANVLHDAQIVADEQVGQPQLFLEVLHEIQNLRLHRHVQRRHRLVRYDEARVHYEGARDANALPLAATESMRVTSGIIYG